MSIRSSFIKKKYLIKIYLFVSVTMLALIMVYSTIVYDRVETKLFNNELNNGKKILIQMKNNIESIDDIVRSICLSSFYNMRSLMFLQKEDLLLESQAQTKLIRSVITTNSFIHSVYVYNNIRKVYFSTIDPFYHEDKLLDAKLKSFSTIPVLKPILRDIETLSSNGEILTEQVITYCYYEQKDEKGRMNGGIVVNINLDWLMNNIQEISSVEEGETDRYFLAGSNGEVIKEKNGSDQFIPEIQAIMQSIGTGTENSSAGYAENNAGTSTRSVDREKYLFSYLEIQNGNFVLFKVSSYDAIYGTIQNFRILFIFITLCFILIGFVAMIGISSILYHPVEEILDHVKSRFDPEEPKIENKDEISLIKETISRSMEKLEKLNAERHTNRRIMKAYFLKRLLLESSEIGWDELLAGFSDHEISLDPKGDYAIFILKMDEYKAFRKNYNRSETERIKTATMDFISRTISTDFPCEVLDTQEGQITVIINTKVEEANFCWKLARLLETVNNHTSRAFNFTFSASVSEISKQYTDISKMYNKAGMNLMYRYVYGRRSLITPAKVASNNRKPGSNLNIESEEKFFEAVRKGDFQQAEEYLSVFFNELKDVNCIGVMFYTTHLINEFRNLICEINEKRDKPVNIGNEFSVERQKEIETLNDLHKQIVNVLNGFKFCGENTEEEKSRMLADTIKDIIDSNYQNPDLNITFIEDMVKLSPSYIGKAFNLHMKMSVPEYVNDVRMTRAVEWMQNSKLSISEVMKRVGVENPSYFYKLFKSKYGKSPREYIQKK